MNANPVPALYADRGRGPALQIKGGFPAAELLSGHFSYLVNPAHVMRVNWATLILDAGESISVSRRYYSDFMACYVKSLK